MIKYLVMFSLFTSCIQSSIPLSEEKANRNNGLQKNDRNKVFTSNNGSRVKKSFIFETKHEPLNSLNYVHVEVSSKDITNIKIYGSTKKNISLSNSKIKSLKHLIHPSDQYINIEVIKENGSTLKHSFNIDKKLITL